MQKNIAGQKWIVFAFNRTTNVPLAGDAANITANLRLDGGAANATDDVNPTELEDGFYVFDISQAESNAELIVISPVSVTSDIQVIGVPGAVYTTPANFPDLAVATNGDITKVATCTTNTDMRGTDAALLAANVNVAAGVVESNLLQIGGVAQSATDLKDFADAGYDPITNKVEGVKLVDTTTTNTDMRGTDGANTVVPDAAGVAPTAIEIRQEIDTNSTKTGYSLSSAGVLAIWHQLVSGIVTAGTIGKLLTDEITAARMQVLTDWIDGGRLDLIIDELTVQGDTNETGINATNTDLSNATDGLGALKALIDTVNTDLSNGTDGLGALKALIDGLNDISAANILTTALTESYAADGATATLSQLLYMIWSVINSLKFVTTTGTSRKLDGVTPAMTFTIDDADNPTDIDRTT